MSKYHAENVNIILIKK